MYRIVTLLSLILLLSFSVTRAQTDKRTQFEPETYGIPNIIAGYKVLAVKSSGTTACMLPNSFRLILQAADNNVQNFLNNNRANIVQEELGKVNSIKSDVKWETIFVGPGVVWDWDKFITGNDRWNNLMKNGCIKLGPASAGSDGEEFDDNPPGYNGYTHFENTDASDEATDDNAQSVNLVPPSYIGDNQEAMVAFLNNVWTDGDYFLQNGFLFVGGGALIVWTDTAFGLNAQSYDDAILPYNSSHTYWFVITYTSTQWFMCAEDNDNQITTYICIPETEGSGVSLAENINTSIFVENMNTNSDWYDGFGDPFEAFGAQIYFSGFGQYWATEHLHTSHACAGSYPTIGALSGRLTAGDSGYFHLQYLPLRC